MTVALGCGLGETAPSSEVTGDETSALQGNLHDQSVQGCDLLVLFVKGTATWSGGPQVQGLTFWRH